MCVNSKYISNNINFTKGSTIKKQKQTQQKKLVQVYLG